MCPASNATFHTPRARMGVRGSGPNQSRVLMARVAKLVFPIPSRRLLRHTFRLTSYASDRPTIASVLTLSRPELGKSLLWPSAPT